jgi:hypothetical protein
VLQTTFFTINATSSIVISENQGIYLTFPKEFDHFMDIPLTAIVTSGNYSIVYTAEVVNRRIGLNLTNMSINANSTFSIAMPSLPCPSLPCIVDMNKLQITVSSSDNLTTTAASI